MPPRVDAARVSVSPHCAEALRTLGIAQTSGISKEVATSYEHTVIEQGFPQGATDAEILRFFVNYAIRAPSGHNTQPWLFRIGERSLELLADRTRALPVVDPHDRALTISCGAALEHLFVAARRFGRDLAVEELTGADPDHLATVKLAGAVEPSSEDVALFEAIPHRRTTRSKFDKRALPRELLNACREHASERGAALTIVEEYSERAEIADLVAEGDRIQFADPRFRRELAAWVHSRRAATKDGMSGESFGMPDILSPIGAMIIRTFDLGNGVAAGDREKITECSPVLAVFSTEGDEAGDWLATGRALSRVLLQLTASGATAAFLNQPIEAEELRPRLGDAIRTTGIPQLLLRFGYGVAAPRSVRRPIDDVLL